MFAAGAPNRVWLTDITEHRTSTEGKVYIVHAERGSQFRSWKMAYALSRHGMVGSMGRVGAAGDNAAMESFWSLLQTNVLPQHRWATRQELRLAIVVWDRTQVPPPTAPGLTRRVDPDRIREPDHH